MVQIHLPDHSFASQVNLLRCALYGEFNFICTDNTDNIATAVVSLESLMPNSRQRSSQHPLVSPFIHGKVSSSQLVYNRLDPWAHRVPAVAAMSKSPPPLAAKEFFTEEFPNDPYPTCPRQLENHDLQFIEIHGGIWAVFQYADCASLIRDPRLSAKRTGTLIDQFPPGQRGELRELEHRLSLWMLCFDAPEHARLRKLRNKGFAPVVVGPLGGGP